MLISFNIRTELEIIQFLNVAIVIENELKLYVGLQAAVRSATSFFRCEKEATSSYEGQSF